MSKPEHERRVARLGYGGKVALTREEIAIGFEVATGLAPREADIHLVQMMGSTTEVLAEYVWDHWMGEPEELPVEQVQAQIEAALEEQEPESLAEVMRHYPDGIPGHPDS